MNAVSLFAGVGGIDLALHQAGIPTVAAVEIDTAARGVLAHRFPDTALFNDVCEVTPDELLTAGFDPRNGILAGGFPCQDLSVAGARRGLAGARSGLFWQIIRLAEALKPQWLLLENVPGLLSSAGGRDMGTVIGALAELGYGISWRVLDAQHFGVPQRRRRIVIVGHLGDNGTTPAQILAISESSSGSVGTQRTSREDVAGTLGGGSGNRGLACDTDRMTFIPQTYRRLGMGHYTPDDKASNVQARDYKSATDLITYVKAKRAQSIIDDETWRLARVSPTLNQFDVGDTRATVLAVDTVVRRLTPLECERLQGFPDQWTAERVDFKTGNVIAQADSPRYKQMGNAVAVPVFRWVADRIAAAHRGAL